MARQRIPLGQTPVGQGFNSEAECNCCKCPQGPGSGQKCQGPYEAPEGLDPETICFSFGSDYSPTQPENCPGNGFCCCAPIVGCLCNYTCTDQGNGLEWVFEICESQCMGTKSPPTSPCEQEGQFGTGGCDECL